MYIPKETKSKCDRIKKKKKTLIGRVRKDEEMAQKVMGQVKGEKLGRKKKKRESQELSKTQKEREQKTEEE